MFDAILGALPSSASPWPKTFPVFAHQGGWDEILLVGVPLASIGVLLWLANRRVNKQLADTAKGSHIGANLPEQQITDSSGP